MPRAVTTGGTAGGEWGLLAAMAAVVGASAALWLAGGLASAVSGPGWHSASFSPVLVLAVARSGTGSWWPGVDPGLVWGLTAALTGLLVVAALTAYLTWSLRRPAADAPLRSLARSADVAALSGRGAVRRARQLRPALAAVPVKAVAPADAGLTLGQLLGSGVRRGRELLASWEDVLLAFMAPRQGKTTTYVVPWALAAPGAVVLTSNKADAWAATAGLRAARTGERVWTFDPQRITYAAQSWWWNPLRGLAGVEEAERLASHFVLTVDDERTRDIWGPAAQELVAALLLAAARAGRTISDVYTWLADDRNPEPAESLDAAGLGAMAASLRGIQGSPDETRGSVYFTARVAVRCLRNPEITAWVTPPPADRGLAEFDPAGFPTSRQTLYLLSKDGGGSAGPLVAALTDRVLRAGVVAAERRAGRLDPPLAVLLDEAANICRIGDLPQLYSHLGSRGIVVLTILQSYAQGVAVWGQTGMRALWSAATVKIVGPGMDDADFAEELSRLIGDHDVAVDTHTTAAGSWSRSRSPRQQRVLPASAIRALPRGRALVWSTGAKVAMVATRPWYAGPQAGEIDAARRAAEAAMTTAATAASDPAARPAADVVRSSP